MIKYPEMRRELISCLESLSDFEYQKKCWLEGICPPNVEEDCFDFSVHFIFDETTLCENSSEYIGVLLYDEKEAEVVKQVADSIGIIFEKYGTELSDMEYIGLDEWSEVLRSSRNALRLINKETKPDQ